MMGEKPNTAANVGWQAMTGALVTIVLWFIHDYHGVVVPPEVASAMTVFLTGLVSYIASKEGSTNG